MSKYSEIMDKISIDSDMQNRVTNNTLKAGPLKNTVKFKNLHKYLSIAASFIILGFAILQVPKLLSLGYSAAEDNGGYYLDKKETSNAYDYVVYESEKTYEGTESGDIDLFTANKKLQNLDKKIIYTANIDLKVNGDDYVETISALKQKITQTDGYIETLTQESYEYHSYTNIVARIPTDNYREFLDGITEYGKVTSLSEESEDITAIYKDYHARLSSKISERERLLELLSKAQTMQDILLIEEKLTQIQADIEYNQSIIDSFDNKVSYCTVTINIHGDKSMTYVEPTFIEKITKAFKDGLNHIFDILENIVLFVAEYGVICVILVLIIIPVYRIIKKRLNR